MDELNLCLVCSISGEILEEGNCIVRNLSGLGSETFQWNFPISALSLMIFKN